MSSGLINLFIIKGGKPKTPEMKLWVHLLSAKFMLALFLTPAVNPVQKWFGFDDELKKQMQAGLVVFMFVYSVLIRAYREDAANNFDEDPLTDKLHEF